MFTARTALCFCAFAATVTVVSFNAFAMEAPLDGHVPIERIIENSQQYIQQHPDDPAGYARLGRANSLAFAASGNKSVKLGYRGKDEPGTLLRITDQPNRWPDSSQRTPGTAQPESIGCLIEAIRNYQEALNRAPEDGLYWLGLGYCLDMLSQENYAGLESAKAPIEEGKLPKDKRSCEDKALEAYRTARTKKSDGSGLGYQSEAGWCIVRILKRRPDATDAEKWEALRLTRILKDGDLAKSFAISPIIFDIKKERHIHELLAEKREVSFDLDGSGRGFLWSWIVPGTSLLVWDPRGTGRITSGRQLFGNVTWWLFWDTGYRALAALDDNQDGQVSGRELEGLAVWTDANGNAISEPGEVVPIQQTAVEALATTVTGRTEGMPFNPRGMRLRGGRELPTYDWIATGHPSKH